MSYWLSVGRSIFLSSQLAFVCRLVLGGIFAYAGWVKIGLQAETVQSVLRFDILPSYLVRPFALTFPWVELIGGVLLILGVLVASSSSLLGLLNLAFLIAIGVSLLRGLNVDCGCFGHAEPASWWIFVRDVGFLLMSAQILVAKPGFLSLQEALSAYWRQKDASQTSY